MCASHLFNIYNIYTQIHIYKSLLLYTCVYIYMHTYIYIYMYIFQSSLHHVIKILCNVVSKKNQRFTSCNLHVSLHDNHRRNKNKR